MENGTLIVRMCVLIAAAAGLPAAPRAMAQSSADTASLQWGVPTTLPTGALVAVVRGDPTGPGETTFLISMPNGYRIAPHFHPGQTHVEVKEGTLLVGMGDKADPSRARRLVGGDSATISGEMHHFWIASERSLVLLTFTGPFTITYLRAEDAPRPRAFPIGY